ncbi:transposable element Tcb1 transposase [Trichonephila clavipes]|uniref:Transposable element Tcb1 transposase n=1 Tax=Trichonephila clavipes TaxID=2585209 RepID=A0A8X6W4B6_TRICX|nr:transposable element Tcb1 transposase [Trichonephila clavipes]
MACGKDRTSSYQISAFDQERIVAYRDCGLSLREIGQHVGRNQAAVCVMRICHHWMQEKTTGQSHPPRCAVASDDRQIVLMAVMDRIATSRRYGLGCIRFHCRTHLVCVTGTLHSQWYMCEMLKPVLPCIQRLPLAIFQQHNARPHMTSSFLEFFTHKIALRPWPSCSPDLSLIKNV